MDRDRLGKGRVQNNGGVFLYLCLFLCLVLVSCSYTDIKREISIPEKIREIKPERPALSEPKIPEFIPVTEDISPVKTRIVDIVARNTPLRDVLHMIAEATGLNLVIEKWVTTEIPVTLTLKNVSAEDALNTIFTSVDYFYSVKDNMLLVKAVDTRLFELGHPAIVQTYSVDAGGDILGGASGGATSIKGNITQTLKNDATAFNFWDAIEKSISSILGTTSGAAQGQSAATQPSAIQPTATQPAATQSAATQSAATQSAATQPAATQPAAIQQSFTVNRLTGTIVVTALKGNIERVEQFLNTVKKVINRQVLVEAKIIEVQLSEGLKYGIDWNLLDQTLGGDWQTNIKTETPGFSSVIPPASPHINMEITRVVNDTIKFRTILKALQSQGEVRTLSNPRVNIMNGQTALLSVGRNISFISKVETTTTTTAGAAPTTTYTVQTSNMLSGIIIGIVPYISENGEISLTVTPIISDLIHLQEKTVGGEKTIRYRFPFRLST